jgi:hypothetical protein
MKKIYILLFTVVLASSCNVLDQVSPNDVADTNVFTSKAGAEAALVGLYSSMQGKYYYGGYYQMVADLNSDNGTDGGYQYTVLDEISAVNVTTSNTIVENIWLALYYTIATSNAIINQIDGINDPNFDPAEKSSIKGQAYAARALAHFDALRMFGEHWDNSSSFGIPIVTSVQKATDIIPRSTVAQSYDAIITDFTTALGLVDANDRSQVYFSPIAIKALLARAYLYSYSAGKSADKVKAIAVATEVIDDGTFNLLDQTTFTKIYTAPYMSNESIFELTFSIQNQSGLNALTYLRESALRSDVFFLANAAMNDFFTNRPDDLRANLIDFNPADNDGSIIPDGRTQKYRGETTRDNPAFIIRIAEVYLIRAEAEGYSPEGLADLNAVRTNRGMTALTNTDITSQSDFTNALLDERRAELNFEGHRMFDLARNAQFATQVGAIKNSTDYTVSDFNAIFPIPKQERIATKGALTQNPGYPED